METNNSMKDLKKNLLQEEIKELPPNPALQSATSNSTNYMIPPNESKHRVNTSDPILENENSNKVANLEDLHNVSVDEFLVNGKK